MRTLIFPIAFLVSASAALAAEIAGVKFPEQTTVDGKTLSLNGTGLRQATIFKVKVYAAGLYVETPSTDPQAILASPGAKKISMAFLRDVEAGKLRDAWKDGFDKNCGNACEEVQPGLAKLSSLMTDRKSGDVMEFVFHASRVEAIINKAAPVAIDGARFSRTLLSVWLDRPADENLKEGLLGKRKP